MPGSAPCVVAVKGAIIRVTAHANCHNRQRWRGNALKYMCTLKHTYVCVYIAIKHGQISVGRVSLAIESAFTPGAHVYALHLAGWRGLLENLPATKVINHEMVFKMVGNKIRQQQWQRQRPRQPWFASFSVARRPKVGGPVAINSSAFSGFYERSTEMANSSSSGPRAAGSAEIATVPHKSGSNSS